MNSTESFQHGLARSASYTLETKAWPARTSVGGCSSNSTLFGLVWNESSPKAGSTKDTAGSVQVCACAISKNVVTGATWLRSKPRNMAVVGTSETKLAH